MKLTYSRTLDNSIHDFRLYRISSMRITNILVKLTILLHLQSTLRRQPEHTRVRYYRKQIQ